jgi:hypothetical protein
VDLGLERDLAHHGAGEQHGEHDDQPPPLHRAAAQSIDHVVERQVQRPLGLEPVGHASL